MSPRVWSTQRPTQKHIEILLLNRCRSKKKKIEIRATANFASRLTLLSHKNGVKTAKVRQIIPIFFAKIGQNECENTYFKFFSSYPGDLVIRTGDREIEQIGSVSGSVGIDAIGGTLTFYLYTHSSDSHKADKIPSSNRDSDEVRIILQVNTLEASMYSVETVTCKTYQRA